MNAVLIGSPGSGKGTQAKMLSEHFNLKIISLGDILREEVKKESELGKEAYRYMEKGALVPDEIVSQVIEENISSHCLSGSTGSGGIILDGFPRNLSQAKALKDILKRLGKVIDIVIYLTADEGTIINRLSKRLVCKNCRANYHLENMPPEQNGICDRCGSKLVQRNDDKPEVIKKRWQIFQEENNKLLDFYSRGGRLISIDGRKDKGIIFDKIKNKLQCIMNH